MRRPLLDRMTDTPTFKILLLLSSIMVLPVLALGIAVSIAFFPSGAWAANPIGLGFVALAGGGAIGITGWARAHGGVRAPARRGISLTLVCLAIGIATAFVVGGFTVVATLAGLREVWTQAEWFSTSLAAAFAAAHGVWILSALGWMERLTRAYCERTGHPFDTLPVVFLLVALGLAAAVPLAATALL